MAIELVKSPIVDENGRDPDLLAKAKNYCRMSYREIEHVVKDVIGIPQDEELDESLRKTLKKSHLDYKYSVLERSKNNEDAY